ncbi:hypothetical protein SteCoe_32072 [Stentor coeruleus]|uniref:Sfi1 spindle body domain-containing protein n=1 Tax=Stentor coeruleus TaxID=5963 RepID=A0A1R2AZT4_9CILI|nr:hypothetical protein SteCoe_32072 [Stentor coeruleus]
MKTPEHLTPGKIITIEGRKSVKFSTETFPNPKVGTIIRLDNPPPPEKTPLFLWWDKIDTIKIAFDDFREQESISIISTFFTTPSQTPRQFSDENNFSKENLQFFLEENLYKNKKLLLKSLDFLIKKMFFPVFLKVWDQKLHTKFLSDKYTSQNRKYIQQKRRLDLNTKVEFDLEQEKEALRELIKMNRPFLASGITGVKNSKHYICLSKKKKSKIKSEIDQKSQELEFKLNMARAIWEKNTMIMMFLAWRLDFEYKKRRNKELKIIRGKSYNSLLYYMFSAWIANTKLQKDKKHCVFIAKRALALRKKYKILKEWKNLSKKPARVAKFMENIKEFLEKRKSARIFISWKWYFTHKKAKIIMNILSKKFHRDNLKAKKFFELKSEIAIIVGSRVKYLMLSKGEENGFNKEHVLITTRFELRIALQKISQSLEKFKQELVIAYQEALKVEQIISGNLFYQKYLSSWKQFLLKKYDKNGSC